MLNRFSNINVTKLIKHVTFVTLVTFSDID